MVIPCLLECKINLLKIFSFRENICTEFINIVCSYKITSYISDEKLGKNCGLILGNYGVLNFGWYTVPELNISSVSA
jgi:hypothetical protein